MTQPYIVCPRCGAVSHNPNDVRERYCGRCHQFHEFTSQPKDAPAPPAGLVLGLQRGHLVRLTYSEGPTTAVAIATVVLASTNGEALALSFDARIGPWAGGVALLWSRGRGTYLDITAGLAFTVERLAS